MADQSNSVIDALDGIRNVLERLAQNCGSRTIEHPRNAKGSEVIEPASPALQQTKQETDGPAARQPKVPARRKRKS
jgi:hypothetical protein